VAEVVDQEWVRPDLVEVLEPGRQPRPGDRVALVASRCDACGRIEFPPRGACPVDQAPAHRHLLQGNAVLAGCTTVHHPPPGALVAAPYHVGVANFDGAIRVLGLLLGAADPPPLGTNLVTVATEFTPGRLTYAFVPSDHPA
jgi:uncharacterized OB-fold protein